MPTQTIKGAAARAALLKGIAELNDCVKITLGPAGRNVLFRVPGFVITTKDGVTVAREVDPADPYESMGAHMAKDTASQTVNQAGDGTTTATLLLHAIFAAAVCAVDEKKMEPVQVARGIRAAAKEIVGSFDEKRKLFSGGLIEQLKIDATAEMIYNVARISANGDEDIARVVADAVMKVGVDGAIQMGMSSTDQHVLEVVDGLQIESGFTSPVFVTDTQRNRAVYDNCLIFLCDRRLSTDIEVKEILERGIKRCQQDAQSFSMLVIANDIDPMAMNMLAGNRLQNRVPIVAIQSPAWGDARRDLLSDIALLTRAKIVDSDQGKNYDELRGNVFGRAARIAVNQQRTVITGYAFEPYEKKRDYDPYIERLRALTSDTGLRPDQVDRAKQRLAALTGGVAVVKVGGNSGGEVKERSFRVEDAIHATRAALADGVVPGGGSALLYAQLMAEGYGDNQGSPSVKAGYDILRGALTEPLFQIARNAGLEGAEAKHQILEFKNHTAGLDASKDECIEDMIAAGIVDPAKVCRAALNAAATTAATLLLNEVIIALEPQKQ